MSVGVMRKMKYEKSCGAIIFREKDGILQTLLIRHKNSAKWAFPKGHTEQGENELDTALREVKEETGVDVLLNRGFREKLKYCPKVNVLKEVVYFLASPGDEEGSIHEITDAIVDEAKWVDIDEVSRLLCFENHLKLFHKALDYYRSH